ncbi:hypothetical protein ACKC9G_00600 [Pokkaliibacter sp. CJK22405]|uniref:hypothetical protein n=1 Tax=Pokkaliibacter sp. CJK22405 TaxID=3384615 RepID=UPI003984F695
MRRDIAGSGVTLSSGIYNGKQYQVIAKRAHNQSGFNQVIVFIEGLPEAGSGDFAFTSREEAADFGYSLVRQVIDGRLLHQG